MIIMMVRGGHDGAAVERVGIVLPPRHDGRLRCTRRVMVNETEIAAPHLLVQGPTEPAWT